MNKLIQKLNRTDTEQEILAALEGTGYSRDEIFIGDLYIEENTKVTYRIVTSCVVLNENTNLKAPKLEVVGDSVYLSQNATLTAPKLEVVGGSVNLYPNATLKVPKSESLNKDI